MSMCDDGGLHTPCRCHTDVVQERFLPARPWLVLLSVHTSIHTYIYLCTSVHTYLHVYISTYMYIAAHRLFGLKLPGRSRDPLSSKTSYVRALRKRPQLVKVPPFVDVRFQKHKTENDRVKPGGSQVDRLFVSRMQPSAAATKGLSSRGTLAHFA